MDGAVTIWSAPVSEVQVLGEEHEPMDWSAYSTQYDHMCDNNPHYQENIDFLLKRLSGWNLPERPRILDVGAGTGNFIQSMADILPNASFTHLDANHEMNEFAREKYESRGIQDISFVEQLVQDTSFETDSFDLIICVHALYSMQPQSLVMRKIGSWLNQKGRLFIIDFGRKHNLVDWGFYFFRELTKQHGFFEYLKRTAQGLEVVKQNRLTRKGQEDGTYWLHSTEEFNKSLVESGFDVEHIQKCYRGYSDLAICTKTLQQS